MRASERETRSSAWRSDDTVLRHRVRSATLLGLLAWLAAAPGTALAQHPDPSIWGASGGPMFAWGSSGFTVGWELSSVVGSPLLHFALGGDYLRGESGTGHAHYLAWEPGYVGGGSLGASLPDGKAGLYLGAWAGLALPLSSRTVGIVESDFQRRAGVVATFCIGYRYIGGEAQFYIAPKLGYYEFPITVD